MDYRCHQERYFSFDMVWTSEVFPLLVWGEQELLKHFHSLLGTTVVVVVVNAWSRWCLDTLYTCLQLSATWGFYLT